MKLGKLLMEKHLNLWN